MTHAEIQGVISTKSKCSATETIAYNMLSLIVEAYDYAFKFSTLSVQGRIRIAVYGVVHQELLNHIRQDVVQKTLHKRVSKYFEVRKEADTFPNKIFANHYFMMRIWTFVQRQATESVVNQPLAKPLEQVHTMKNNKH